MTLLESPLAIGIIGFFGGIIGGVIVNIISTKFRMREERLAEETKLKNEYLNSIKSLLNEIIERYEKELAKKNRDLRSLRGIQNDFSVASHQLTSIIANAPKDFSQEIIAQLRELNNALAKNSDMTVGIGADLVHSFNVQSKETIKLTKEIRKKID